MTSINPPADPKPGTVWLVVGRLPHDGQVVLREEAVQTGIYRETLSTLSDDECTEIAQITTAAAKLDRGSDAGATVLKTLARSLGDLDSQNAAGTTRFLAGIKASGWISEIDSVPFKSWMQDQVADRALAKTTGKGPYTQMRLLALAIQLGKTQAEVPFLQAFTDCLRRSPAFFDESEEADIQNVLLHETVVSPDDLISLAAETPNHVAKEFLVSRAGCPKSETAYRSLIAMLGDKTLVGPMPFYVHVLGKLCALTNNKDNLRPQMPQAATAAGQWQRLREFWRQTSYTAFKSMRGTPPSRSLIVG
ncbi:MAG TPA: hypothetical protein VG820_10640 [Fimbriimonadaceae bacterium]|nr:hypothetical protein [Fimbriimonadaceae bacterium]